MEVTECTTESILVKGKVGSVFNKASGPSYKY